MASCNAGTGGFFAPAADTSTGLDPNGIYPQGKKIAFGVYTIQGTNVFDPTKTNMERVVEEGFTLAGPYYHSNWSNFQHITEAAANGLQYTYHVREHPSLLGVSVANRPAAIDLLSDADIQDHVELQLEMIFSNTTVNDTIARWAFLPEELRGWKPQDLRYLQVAADHVKQVELDNSIPHRPLWMYEPNHRDQSDLETTGIHQDIVSKGTYLTTKHDRGEQRAGYAMWSLDQILGAADTLGTLPQTVYQLSEDFTDPLTGTNPSEINRVLRHDVYLGLTKGIKSLNVWSMHEFRPNLTTHNEQFEAYGSVAQDLTGPLNLQRLFLFGEDRNDLTFTVAQGDPTIDYVHDDNTPFSYNSLHSMEVALDSDRYIMLVNSTEALMDVLIDGLPQQYILEDLFNNTSIISTDQSLTWQLDVLGVAALRIRPMEADFTLNGIVAGDDLASWENGFGMVGGATPMNGDSDLDGDVDGADFLTWQRQFIGTAPSSTTSAIPEPATSLLLILSSMFGFVMVRRGIHR